MNTGLLCSDELDHAFRSAVSRCQISHELAEPLQKLANSHLRLLEDINAFKQEFDEIYGQIIAYLAREDAE